MAKAIGERQQRRVERLLAQLKDYLGVRFEHAIRVNPKVKNIYDDMVFQHLALVRGVFEMERMFGENRFVICDLFASGDEEKKSQVLNPMDQNSIMSLMVEDKAEVATDKKRAGMLSVDDLPSLYASLDPGLESIMELIRIWVWWDLPDAGYVANFDNWHQQLGHLAQTHGLSAPAINEYLKKPPAEKTMEEWLTPTGEEPHETQTGRLFMSLVRTRNRFERMRQRDESHRVILKRRRNVDESDDAQRLIVEAAKRIMASDKVRDTDTIDTALAQYYAKVFQCPAEKVTAQNIVEHEQSRMRELLPRLLDTLEHSSELGPPYDYKLRQLEKMDETIAQFRKVLKVSEDYELPTLESEIQRATVSEMNVQLIDEEEQPLVDDDDDEAKLPFDF
ncbi:hypothetical protein ACFL34_02310 [Candidatus Sumerlaeota bacterium]